MSAAPDGPRPLADFSAAAPTAPDGPRPPADFSAAAPIALDRPTLLYDGECAACRNWALRLREVTHDGVACVPFQEAGATSTGLDTGALRGAVHLLEPDGRVTAGAEAIFRALRGTRRGRLALWAWRYVPGFRPVSRRVYAWVAARRRRD